MTTSKTGRRLRLVVLYFLWPDGAMFCRAEISRVYQCHGFQIVTAADRRLVLVLQGDEQLGHRAGKSIREPALAPDRAFKFRAVLGSVFNCRGSRVWVLTPSDCSQRQSIEALDAPADVKIRRAAFTRGACPGIVNRNATQAAIVFQDVSADAVLVAKLRARVRSHTAIDPLRLSKPIAKSIQVMNRHNPQRHPAQPFLPGHPMRDAAHLDRCQNRFAQSPILKESFSGANGLVVTHVLVYRQGNAGLFACLPSL